MSHVIPISKINQFLPREKLDLNENVPQGEQYPEDHHLISDLEETARDIVLGLLAETYDVSTWSNGPTSAPTMIRNIIGLLVAGWVYDRQFSEYAEQGTTYGQRRVDEAYALIQQLVDGTIVIPGTDAIFDESKKASTLETEPVFTMGTQF